MMYLRRMGATDDEPSGLDELIAYVREQLSFADPADVEALIAGILEQRPEDRPDYASRGINEIFRRYEADAEAFTGGASAGPVSEQFSGTRSGWSPRLMATVIVGTVAAAGVGGLLLLRRRR